MPIGVRTALGLLATSIAHRILSVEYARECTGFWTLFPTANPYCYYVDAGIKALGLVLASTAILFASGGMVVGGGGGVRRPFAPPPSNTAPPG